MFLSGGLAEEVDEKVLHAAFIPFGDITDIQIPIDYETGKTTSCFHQLVFLSNIHSQWVRGKLSSDDVSCVLFSEKHRGFAFIEFELGEVGEVHTEIGPLKTILLFTLSSMRS